MQETYLREAPRNKHKVCAYVISCIYSFIQMHAVIIVASAVARASQEETQQVRYAFSIAIDNGNLFLLYITYLTKTIRITANHCTHQIRFY